MRRIYELRRPTDDDLARYAARLARLDAEALAAGNDERTRLARLCDVERRQSSALALPAEWRTRDRLRSPEWPPHARLDLWRAIGASHALAMRPPDPRVWAPPVPPDVHHLPHAVAYSHGYLATIKGYMMPDQHPQHAPVQLVSIEAATVDLTPQTLGAYLVEGDVSNLTPGDRAHVLVALHRMYGLHPLSKAFIIIEGKKIYPTAAALAAVRRKEDLGVEVTETEIVDFGGVKLLHAIAECGPQDIIMARRGERRAAKKEGRESDVADDPDVTETDTYLPWQVDRWTDKKGVKAWQDPTPDQLANSLMKLSTKAKRRATFERAGLGGTAAEDMPPGGSRDFIEPTVEQVEPPHDDEAGA